MPVSVSLSVYNIELLDLTCNIGYKGRIRPLPPIMNQFKVALVYTSRYSKTHSCVSATLNCKN